MTWTDFLDNSYIEDHIDEYHIVHNDDFEIGCVIVPEDTSGGWWFKSHEGLPKPAKEEAEAAFKKISDYYYVEEGEQMSDYEFYKQTFGC